MNNRAMIVATAGAVALLTLEPATAGAQPPRPAAWSDSVVTIVPGPRYAKSGLYREIAGRHYRQVWTTPIEVPVLDLKRFAGGLTPLKAHSGSQTKSLRFAGANGREYQFRSVDKDPTASLAPELQGSAYAKALQDGVSHSFPAAAVVASGLLEVAGVLHPKQELAVMPDDPALGAFREEFKGVLGMIEERADDYDEERTGPGGLRKVISPTRLFELVDASPADQVDTRAFLRARLMDILMGDRDRHRDQFRWAAATNSRPVRWQPISRDHDEAFVNLDGLALEVSRLYYPPLVTFDATYPKHYQLNWHAREVDRRFLAGLSRGTWDSVATALQQVLTDAAIANAVRRMPAEMYPIAGARLIGLLQSRRDGLVQEALSYYDFLSREVEIRATNTAEVTEITREDAHHVAVSIRAAGEDRPYFARRFDDRETREIRLMLWGGDDRVSVRGEAGPNIRLRVIGGDGDDVFVDSTGADGINYYDDTGTTTLESVRGSLNTKHHTEWVGSDTNRFPPREWGSWLRPLPWLEANNDLGVFVGGGFLSTKYGFRRAPYQSQIRALFGYASGAQAIRVAIDGEFHLENASPFWRVHLLASGIEVIRYYGLGNDSERQGSRNFHRVDQQLYSVEPELVVPVGAHLKLNALVSARWSHTSSNTGRWIATIRDTLLGASDFGQVGGGVGFEVDTRDRPVNPTSGIHVTGGARIVPGLWDVPRTFGSVEGEAAAFISAPAPFKPTLAFRVGGRRVWGRFPFQESAFLGGASSLPGYASNRFAGDGSIYGSVQLRVTVGRTDLALPAVWGFFGSTDAGRVYVRGQTPGGWHRDAGGGVWLAFLDRRNTVSFAVMSSNEGARFQAGVAFGF